MRLHRILFALFAAFLFFFWMLYGGMIPKLMFLCAAAPFAASLAMTLLGRFGVRVTRTGGEGRAVKGDRAVYTVTLENRLPVPLFYMTAVFSGDPLIFPEGTSRVPFSLRVRESKTLRFEVDCRYRGRFEAGLSHIVYEDFLGLLRFRRRFDRGAGLLVYPRVLPLERLSVDARLPHDNRDAAGGLNVNITSVRDIRQYRVGDSVRFTHWKLSAKRGELLLKEFERTSSESVLFLFDMVPSAGSRGEYIPKEDLIIEAAASSANWLLCENAACRLLLPQKSGIQTFDALRREDFPFIYEMLAHAEFDTGIALERLLIDQLTAEQQGKSIYVFSVDPSEAALQMLNEAVYKGFDIHLVTAAGGETESAADVRGLSASTDVRDVLEGRAGADGR